MAHRILNFFMHDEEYLRRELRIQRRRLRDGSNPFDMYETEFTGIYRLPQELVLVLKNFVAPHMVSTTIPKEMRILCALSFLAEDQIFLILGSINLPVKFIISKYKLANNNNNNNSGGVSNAAGASNAGAQQGASNASNRSAAAPVGENVAAAGDWNPEECDRFSFDDSDRFEEDSLCSWSSEPESLCNNWRGWKRPTTNQQNISTSNWFSTASVLLSQKKIQDNDQVISLTELAAKCVASFIPFELVEHVYPPVPEQLQLRIAFWSFPDNEEDIRLYSCLANSSADEFHRGDQLFKNRAVKDPLQIGFHLSATVLSQQPRAQFNVAVTFDRRRVSSCNCTCTSSAYWCSHVVAVCLHRIHCPNEVCLRAPVSESLTRLQRDQLQKFAQYLISELPQQILPTAQRLLDELLSSQPTAINTVCGAPDPTAGASANDQTSWYLDEKTLHENIKRILIKFCLPAPIVFSDVNYLTNSAPPAAAEWSSLLRPLRGREPEGMWNLLSIVREMYRRCDRNAVRLLEIITEECMACDQILIWWFYTKLSMLVGTNGHSGGGGGKHSNTHSNSNASQHACSSLCDEIVVLWRLAALNPGLAPDERDMLHAQFTAWHLKILDRVVKCRMQPSSYNNSKHQQNSRTDAELFIGFKPAIEACYLDWEDYPIAGVTHTQETNPIYYSPFTCFKHSDASRSDTSAVSSQVNSSQAALMANNTKHYSYISSSDHHYSHSIMKSRYENRPFRNSCTPAVVNNALIANSSSNDYSINNSNCNTTDPANSRLKVSNNLNKNSNLAGVPGSSKNITQSMNDGNHSSASSEGFCENNDDFCGDNSGGQTLQPPVGVRLTQQQPENQKTSQESLTNENNKVTCADVTVDSALNTNSNTALNKKQTNLAGASGVITVTDVNKFLTSMKNNCKGNSTNSNNCANINLQQQQIENGLQSSHMISSASSSSSSSSSSVPLSLSASSTSSTSCAAVEVVENVAGSSKDFAGIDICPISNRTEQRRQSKDDSSSSSSEIDEMGAVGGIVPKNDSNVKTTESMSPNKLSTSNLGVVPIAPPPATSTVPQFLAQYNYSQYTIVYGKQGGNTKQQIFSNLRPSEDAWDILLARAEGLHAHGHGREACILAVRLAEEMLSHPPNLMIELPQPPRRKGKKQNINPINHQLSVLASATLSKCAFLCTVLAENSEHYHLAFRTCLFALEMPRPPASTKPLEVKLANQEADLLALLKKIPLNQAELRVIRERAEQLKSGTIKSRGEALLPINLASFIFDALVMPSISGKENRNKLMALPYRNPTDENLGFEAAVAALGMKANVSEAEHPLLCEGTRRQRGDLALTLLSYYKDEPRKVAKIMEKLLDREIHVLLKQPLLPAYYSNNPPVRTPATQSRRQEQDLLYSSNPEVYSEFGTVPGGGNSRPHSSTSAEIEIGMGGLSISSQTSLPSAQQNSGLNVSTGATSRSKDLRYKGKRAYPSIPNQPSEASAHFMFELAKNVLTKAGGTSSTSLFTQATTNQNHHGPHRALHMCAFQLGLYALGLHNCVSPNWLSRTYSSHVSWIIGQAMEIGAPAISFLIDTWEGHLTPPEAAGMADRASRGWDNNMVYPAAELALSVLPHAAALNPNEIQRAILQCKEQSDQMLERACITVENAAKGGGVYPEVLFQVARYWYELYLRNTPNSEQEHDGNDIDHSVSLSALLDSQAAEVAAVAAHQQLQAQQQQQSQPTQQQPTQIAGPPQQVVVTAAPPPYPQAVSSLAPLNIAPYPPYSFCPSIYHHHSLAAYPGNQMQMYISAGPQNGPPPPHQGYQYPPPPPAQQQQQPPQISGSQSQPSVYGGPPNGFQSMPPPPIVNQQQQQPQQPPTVYSQPMQCPPGAVPPPANYNQQLVQMQQNMQYYSQSMAMVPQQQQQPGTLRLQPNHHGIVYPYLPQQQPPLAPQQPAVPHQMQRQRHPHQFTPTQLRYLLAAYNVGMLAMETLARRVHDDRPQAKYARNPPYGEDVKWLLRISKKLGTQYLHQFCICAVNSIVSPFVLHDVAIESAHYLGRNNHALVMQHLRSALTPLVQKCQQMYIQCIHQKLYHLTQADYEDFANIILAARAAFQITPEGNAQFKDWLQSIKRSKSCKKDLWAQINTALQSNSK